MIARLLLMIRIELAVMRQELGAILAVFISPFVFVLFFRTGLTNGVDQAIPGMATWFAFFLVGFTCHTLFREHGFNTWSRLQASPLRTWEVLLGKTIPYMGLGSMQLVGLFAFGWATGMSLDGSVLVLAIACICVPVCATSLSVLIFALTKSLQQATGIANLLSLLLAGMAGAFAPISTFPSWVQTLSRLSPQYWTLRSFEAVVNGYQTRGAVASLMVITFFTVFFSSIAVSRFDRNAVKEFRDG